MLYNTNNVVTPKALLPSFIPAGIHENISLVNVKVEESPKGYTFIAFEFKDDQSNTFTYTEWPKTSDRPYTAMSDDERAKFENKIQNQVSKITQVLETFVPKGTYTPIEVNSFIDFITKVKELLKDKMDNTKVRIKVVYDNKNYTTFPTFADEVFIESMSVSKENSKIRQLGKDRMTKSYPDTNQRSTNPFASQEHLPVPSSTLSPF